MTGIVPISGRPPVNYYYSTALSNPSGTTSATAIMMGLGASWILTPVFSGRIRIIVNGRTSNTFATGSTSVQAYYNTGTAPANGDAVTGTLSGRGANNVDVLGSTAQAFAFTTVVTGLTIGATYWFDLALSSAGGGTASVAGLTVSTEEF